MTNKPTLSAYIGSKLGITLKEYCAYNNENSDTLYSAWRKPRGRQRIEDRVFKMAADRQTIDDGIVVLQSEDKQL